MQPNTSEHHVPGTGLYTKVHNCEQDKQDPCSCGSCITVEKAEKITANKPIR